MYSSKRSALDDVLDFTFRLRPERQTLAIDSRDKNDSFGLVPLSKNLSRRYRFPGPLRQRVSESIGDRVQWTAVRLMQRRQPAVRGGEDPVFLV